MVILQPQMMTLIQVSKFGDKLSQLGVLNLVTSTITRLLDRFIYKACELMTFSCFHANLNTEPI